MIKFSLFIAIISAVSLVTSALPTNVVEKRSPTQSGILPTSSPAYFPKFPSRSTKPKSPVPTGPIRSKSNFNRASYPRPWDTPDVNHPEIQRAIKAIDWNHVPKFAPRTVGMEYDEHQDEACWWTESQCTKPKVSYLPEDVKFCPNSGDFGLVSFSFLILNMYIILISFFL